MEELQESLKVINQELRKETEKMIELTEKIENLEKQKSTILTILNDLTKEY
jgi:flagellar motility protein MotE (MotC chaperone)